MFIDSKRGKPIERTTFRISESCNLVGAEFAHVLGASLEDCEAFMQDFRTAQSRVGGSREDVACEADPPNEKIFCGVSGNAAFLKLDFGHAFLIERKGRGWTVALRGGPVGEVFERDGKKVLHFHIPSPI